MKLIDKYGVTHTSKTLKDKISNTKKALVNNHYINLLSHAHEDHMAAYLAWLEVGGVILINNPYNPKEMQEQTIAQMDAMEFTEPSICFLTSGTTGFIKIVVHTESSIQHIAKVARCIPGWEPNDKLVSIMPAFTSGFWHFQLWPAIQENLNKTITMIPVDVNPAGLGNTLLTSPGQVDKARMLFGDKLDYSGYYVCCGASQVLNRHIEEVFSRGAHGFGKTFGATETGAPSLIGMTDLPPSKYEFADCYKLEAIGGLYDLKLVDNELWIRSDGLCQNKHEFDLVDDWMNTHDCFEFVEGQDNLMRFTGRKSDSVKMNGFIANLLEVENIMEAEFNCGTIMVKKHNRLGSDFLEVQYTNKDWKPKPDIIEEVLRDKMSKCCIPKKFTYIEDVPRTSMGKKKRNLNWT